MLVRTTQYILNSFESFPIHVLSRVQASTSLSVIVTVYAFL